MDAKLKPLFEAAVKDKQVPGIGAFVVDSKGNFLLKETFGTKHLNDPTAAPFDADTPVQIFSCTKIITTIAALQLLEQGKLSLSDPVEKYVPEIADVQVMESIKPDEAPVLRAPKTKVTILHLLTHTAGFTYDFFDVPTLLYRQHTGRPPLGYHNTAVWDDFKTPLTADPGTKYCYGVNTDWVGFVIQAVSGMSLPDYLEAHILQPLGMRQTSAKLNPDNGRLYVHINMGPEAGLVGDPNSKNNENPPLWGGGGFLYSTMNDFAKLLATILNGGTSPETGKSILKPENVTKYLFTDHLPPSADKSLLGEIGTSMPIISMEGSFLPSVPATSKGWSTGLLLNGEDLPYGRKAGSGAWAGLGNLYYWIDPATGIAGMVVSSVLPFVSPPIMRLFDEVERVAYGHDVTEEGFDDTKRNFKNK